MIKININHKIIIFLLINFFHAKAHDVLVEAKVAAFLPTNHLFQKIYGHVGGVYGVEATGRLYEELYGWANISVFEKSGCSVGGNYHTRALIVPLDAGLKYLHHFKHVDLYVGLGATATYLQTKNDSPFVIPKLSNWGGGAVLKSGCNIYLPKSVFIDLFLDYSFIKVGFHDSCTAKVQLHKANISGASLGVGFGYRF